MKKLGVAVVAVVVLLVAGVAVLLLPPHLQIRGIEPELPDADELRSLLRVEDGPTSLEVLRIAEQTSADAAIGHNVFVLRWADGRAFMIDAGMDRQGAAEFAELIGMVFGPNEYVFVANVADALGDRIGRVEGVGFTHLHIDHTQGLSVFCERRGAGARLYQTPDQASEHNLHTQEGAEIAANSCLAEGRVGDGLIRSVPEFPGLALVALGGHTPGSTLFAAGVGERLFLFSGDITNSKRDLLEDRGKGFMYSYLMVPENTGRTAQLRAWLTALDGEDDASVVVSHDTDALRRIGLLPPRG